MSKDTVYRQAAIEAFEKFIHEIGIEDAPYNYGEIALCEANVPSAERVENIPFRALRMVCRYNTLSYDADKGCVPACHLTVNRIDGESWGKCTEHDCPFWKETEDERIN